MLANPAFQAEYRPFVDSHPDWGAIARLPWDEATFGFHVADLCLPVIPDRISIPIFRDAIYRFCRLNQCELVSARAGGSEMAMQQLFTAAGFTPVDFSLMATQPNLKALTLPERRFTLRPAEPEDQAEILRIAGSAFVFGRYHGDPRFPRELANARYVHWMRLALKDAGSDDKVLVLGAPGAVIGFMNVIVRNGHADLRLGAIDPSNEFGFLGFFLYAEVLRWMRNMGVRRASAKISAANTRVLNVCAKLGFQFSNAEAVYHWHSPDATHLLPTLFPERIALL